MDITRHGAIDHEAEKFGATVVTTRVHQLFSFVYQREIQIGDDHAFPRTERLTNQFALWRDDCGKASAGDRCDVVRSCVFHDLCLLIGVKPRRRVYDEASRFKRMLADIDLSLFGENVASERTGIHCGMNLLAIGHQGVTRQRIVVLPACQLTDASDGTVDSTQSGTVPLSSNHAFVESRCNLAAPLNQCSVCIEQQLRVVDRASVALIDAN
jgi:hypothetical protein